jgi:hypothetical protein
MSIEFLLTSLIVVATPGTGVLYTVSAGLSRGFRASVIAAVGCTLGIIPHMLAAITGLAALLHTSALAFDTLKYLGVAYLLFLSWSTLKDKDALMVEEDAAPRSAVTVIVSGILVNILNPKLTIFFFAFLPQFVSANEPNRGAAHGRVERSFHGAHVHRVRRLREIRCRRSEPRHLPPTSVDLDAPRLRGRLCCTRSSTRVHRSITNRPASLSSGHPSFLGTTRMQGGRSSRVLAGASAGRRGSGGAAPDRRVRRSLHRPRPRDGLRR